MNRNVKDSNRSMLQGYTTYTIWKVSEASCLRSEDSHHVTSGEILSSSGEQGPQSPPVPATTVCQWI